MKLSEIIVSIFICIILSLATIKVWSELKDKMPNEPERVVPPCKRLENNPYPARSVSRNIDLVKERSGYALYYYSKAGCDTVVIRGDRGGILYIGYGYSEEYFHENVYYIAHSDHHGKSSKPAVGCISDNSNSPKVAPLEFMSERLNLISD